MPLKTLRGFKGELEAWGRLRRVDAEVDKDRDLACIARWVIECVGPDDVYALQFDHVKSHEHPVVVGLFSSLEFYGRALDAEPAYILDRWGAALREPIPPKTVQDAPVLEHVDVGDAVNLLEIPVPVWTPGRDGGPYLPSAAVITKDPETGVQNVGVYRVQIHGRKKTGLFFGSEKQHGAIHWAKYRKANRPMPIALVIGAAPAVCFASAAKTAYGVDEMEIAGGLCGQSVPVVRGRTVDLLVPADAEYVIEGHVPPAELEMEGPFGEGLGFMNAAAPAPVIHVSALCRRQDPFFHGYVQQLPPSEGHLVWEFGALGPLWHYLRDRAGLKLISDLAVVPGAAGLSALVIQVEAVRRDGVKRLLDVTGSLQFGQKQVIVVDEDVEIRDLESLQWAISTRVDPARDVRILDGIQTYLVDPSILARNRASTEENDVSSGESGSAPYLSSMMLVDATQTCRAPEVSLPSRAAMLQALSDWDRWDLPKLSIRNRLLRLMEHHSDCGLYFGFGGQGEISPDTAGQPPIKGPR